MSSVGEISRSGTRMVVGVRELATRERCRLLAEFGDVRGLMPLLMKSRNHEEWTREDKALLRRHIKRMSVLSPYLLLAVMPGGFLVLPALAWWLDRRRGRRDPANHAG